MMLNFPVNQRLTTRSPPAIRSRSSAPRDARQRAARCAVGAVPAKPRRARPRLAHRRAAKARVRGVRAGAAHAALRPRHPPAPRADARQRPPAPGARLQPALLAAGHADDPVRRRDRHGRGPRAQGARGDAHAHAKSAEPHGGFTRATKPLLPVVDGKASATRRSTSTRSAAIRAPS